MRQSNERAVEIAAGVPSHTERLTRHKSREAQQTGAFLKKAKKSDVRRAIEKKTRKAQRRRG